MAEERTRIHTRIIPETEHKIAAAMPPSNCQTQNEFVKKALRFYCDYTSPPELLFRPAAHARRGNPGQ